MSDNKSGTPPREDDSKIDEDLGVMIYGNIKIIDVDSGEMLVNKRG